MSYFTFHIRKEYLKELLYYSINSMHVELYE